jgi:D-lactate dehydrogenase (cytochrome)
MRDNVLALEVVLPSGEIITTARRARKSSAGYDLTRLFVGSEGTLGVITKITLRLHGQPESISSGVCPFPSVRAACDTAIGAIQSGIPVARVELVDALCMRGFNLHAGMAMPETPMLFVEFHGSEAGVAEQAARFGEIAESVGGGPFEWAGAEEERQRLWQARHNAYWAALALKPGATAMSTDVCVPISRLAECVEATQADIEAAGLIAPIVGHVGDGNFHVLPLMDPNDAAERDRVAAFSHRLVERALAMEGTCTGEHGIGQGKRRYLAAEHGDGVLAVMRALKSAIDPLGIMNPGKVVG